MCPALCCSCHGAAVIGWVHRGWFFRIRQHVHGPEAAMVDEAQSTAGRCVRCCWPVPVDVHAPRVAHPVQQARAHTCASPCMCPPHPQGHRLKNMNCKLIRELRTLHAENKLLLTGTPLQVSALICWLIGELPLFACGAGSKLLLTGTPLQVGDGAE